MVFFLWCSMCVGEEGQAGRGGTVVVIAAVVVVVVVVVVSSCGWKGFNLLYFRR